MARLGICSGHYTRWKVQPNITLGPHTIATTHSSPKIPQRQRVHVCCDDEQHKSYECKKVVTPTERKPKLQAKKLCFNCTGDRHHAAQCRSRVTCFHCKKKTAFVYASICDTLGKPPPNQIPGGV
ncbi:Hypothetical predicted protein, partial [Paramuricea clavata]